MGRKESNQTNKQNNMVRAVHHSVAQFGQCHCIFSWLTGANTNHQTPSPAVHRPGTPYKLWLKPRHRGHSSLPIMRPWKGVPVSHIPLIILTNIPYP